MENMLKELRTQRAVVITIMVVALFTVSVFISGCVLQNPLKGKEINKWGIMESAIKTELALMNSYRKAVKSAYEAGEMTDEQLNKAKGTYTKWQRAHNTAMDAMTELQNLINAGSGINEETLWKQIDIMKASSERLMNQFIMLLRGMGVI